MSIKTFTTGEVLTAADTNTYLANAGLVYITEASAAAGATTLSINNCFSTTYDNYRVVVSHADGTVATGLYLRFRNGGTDRTTNYFYAQLGLTTAGGASNDSSGSAALIPIGYLGTSGPYSVTSMDIFQVYTSTLETYGTIQMSFYLAPNYYARVGNFGRGADQNDGFTIYPGSGSLDSLKVRVYGYRQS